MLSILFAVALLFILANLLLILALFLLVFKSFHKLIGETTLNSWNLEGFVPAGVKGLVNQVTGSAESNRYAPTEGVPATELPLDQFVPDPTKQITIKYESAGEDHGLTVEEETK